MMEQEGLDLPLNIEQIRKLLEPNAHVFNPIYSKDRPFRQWRKYSDSGSAVYNAFILEQECVDKRGLMDYDEWIAFQTEVWETVGRSLDFMTSIGDAQERHHTISQQINLVRLLIHKYPPKEVNRVLGIEEAIPYIIKKRLSRAVFDASDRLLDLGVKLPFVGELSYQERERRNLESLACEEKVQELIATQPHLQFVVQHWTDGVSPRTLIQDFLQIPLSGGEVHGITTGIRRVFGLRYREYKGEEERRVDKHTGAIPLRRMVFIYALEHRSRWQTDCFGDRRDFLCDFVGCYQKLMMERKEFPERIRAGRRIDYIDLLHFWRILMRLQGLSRDDLMNNSNHRNGRDLSEEEIIESIEKHQQLGNTPDSLLVLMAMYVQEKDIRGIAKRIAERMNYSVAVLDTALRTGFKVMENYLLSDDTFPRPQELSRGRVREFEAIREGISKLKSSPSILPPNVE